MKMRTLMLIGMIVAIAAVSASPKLGQTAATTMLRAQGEKSSDGSHFKSEEIVSGPFRTIAGTVIAFDLITNTVKFRPLGEGQPLTVAINKDSLLRRISPDLSATIARRVQETAPAASATSASARDSGVHHPATVGQPGGESTKSNDLNFQQALERSPVLTLAELKPGDKVMLSSATEAGASPVIAIVFITSVDPIFELLQRQTRPNTTRTPNITAGLPADALGGIGTP